MSFVVGMVVLALGGVFEGLFSLPVKESKVWKFENIWGIGSLFALLILPWPLVYVTVPDVGELYSSMPGEVLLWVAGFGVAWGVGGIFWGRAIDVLGMALGVSLLMSLINVFGSLGPLAIFEPSKLSTVGGYALIAALCVMIIGVVLISIAGRKKEKEQDILAGTPHAGTKKVSFKRGLLFCVLSAILSAGVNFAFIYGAPIADRAADMGVAVYASSFAVWSIVFSANYLVNTIYGFWLMTRNRTWGLLFRAEGSRHWLGAIFMAITWPGGIILYGIGATAMGNYGAYAGFPMMLLSSIVAGNVAGVWRGEWKGTSVRPRRLMFAGIVVLAISFVFLAYSNHLLNP